MSGGVGKLMVCGPAGITLLDAADWALVPVALVAVTRQVTALPLVSVETTIGELAPVLLRAPHVAV